MRILVVDDDDKLRDAVEGILTRHGHRVDCTSNARDGVDMAGRNQYDVVLLDYWMPEHNGLWFINNATLPRRTKTLLMTAYAGGKFIKRLLDAGISDYVPKPFDEAELICHLESLSKGTQ